MFSATLHSTADIRILKWEKIGIYEREREREREREGVTKEIKKNISMEFYWKFSLFKMMNTVLKYTISYREEPKEFFW